MSEQNSKRGENFLEKCEVFAKRFLLFDRNDLTEQCNLKYAGSEFLTRKNIKILPKNLYEI